MLPSYLKDDNDFLPKLQENNTNQSLPLDTLLVSWDVKSLYTKIPHEAGLNACEHYIHRNNFDDNKIDTNLSFIS